MKTPQSPVQISAMSSSPPQVARRPSLARLARRALTWPLVMLAAVVVLFDDAFRAWVKPLVARIARLGLVRRIEVWIAGLPPYGIVTLFIVPMIVIEPMKIAALYLMGTGHILTGILTLFFAKAVGVGLAERLFAIGRDKLLSIGWFRWLFERAMRVKDTVHAWLESKSFWGVAKAMILRLKATLARLREAFAAWRQRRGRGRWAAARRVWSGTASPRPEPRDL